MTAHEQALIVLRAVLEFDHREDGPHLPAELFKEVVHTIGVLQAEISEVQE